MSPAKHWRMAFVLLGPVVPVISPGGITVSASGTAQSSGAPSRRLGTAIPTRTAVLPQAVPRRARPGLLYRQFRGALRSGKRPSHVGGESLLRPRRVGCGNRTGGSAARHARCRLRLLRDPLLPSLLLMRALGQPFPSWPTVAFKFEFRSESFAARPSRLRVAGGPF